MSFAHPWAWILGALSVPVVLMYLHRWQRSKRPVSSTILWRHLRDEQPTSSSARSRLRHRLSLALVLLALVAALFALARPLGGGGSTHRTIILLDRSASLGSKDAGARDRLALAGDLVAQTVRELGADDEAALITTGQDAGVVVAPTRDHDELLVRTQAIVQAGAQGDNGSDALAMQLAAGLCRDPQKTRIVVISDGAGLSLPKVDCPVEHLSAARGTPGGNLGLTALSLRPADGLGLYDVHLGVASTLGERRNVDISLSSGGEVIDVVSLEVPAHGDVEKTVRITATPGGRLEAALPGSDALAIDDKADVALTGDGPVRVLLVSDRPQSLVASVLGLHPRVVLMTAAHGQLPADPQDLVVLEAAPRGPLPPAGHVVALGVVPEGAPLELVAAPAASEVSIVRWDFASPLFHYVDLRDVVVRKSALVRGGRSLVDATGGTIAAGTSWDGRELVVTGFGPDDTDLTLRAGFPNLMANLVEWAAPAEAAPIPPRGVLSAAETHLEAGPLPGQPARAPSRWSLPALASLAAGLALLLLCSEQLATALLARRRRVS